MTVGTVWAGRSDLDLLPEDHRDRNPGWALTLGGQARSQGRQEQRNDQDHDPLPKPGGVRRTCRDDAAGTWQASHFSWRIRSVLWAGILYLLTSWLWLLFIIPGWIAWALISLWFLYRIVKGMVRMNSGRPVEPQNVI